MIASLRRNIKGSLTLLFLGLGYAFLLFPAFPKPAFSKPVEKSITQIVEEEGKAVLVISNLGFGDSQQAVGSGFVVP